MEENERADGRQRLVDATLDCLAEYGCQGSLVRRIASTAGVVLNLVRHHFGGKTGLMRESYRQFRQNGVTAYVSGAESAGEAPVKRLEAFSATLILGQAAERRRIMNIWISFLPLLMADRSTSAIQTEVYDFFVIPKNLTFQILLRTRCNHLCNTNGTVRRARRPYLAGANPARQLSLQPVAVGAAEGGNDLG